MSQQYMDPGKQRPDEQDAIYNDYDGQPKYDTYSKAFSGQKQPLKSSPASLSTGQRLTLAVVSLFLWIVVCLIVVIGIVHIPLTVDLNQGLLINNPYALISYVLLISALLMFTALAIVINILFNRRR